MWKQRISAWILIVVAVSACSSTGGSAALSDSSTDQAAISSSTEDECELYVATVLAISEYSSETLTLSGELFSMMGDTATLVALLADQDTIDDLIQTLDGVSDKFALARRELPAAPAPWSLVDSHLRTALADYESGYSAAAAAFREFGHGNIEEATAILSGATDDIGRGRKSIEEATAAIPSKAC
jgi:hypothetical protein